MEYCDRNHMEEPLVSVVIPCYDEAEVMRGTLSRLNQMAQSLDSCRFEFIFIDDGSKDDTLEILRQAAQDDGRIRVIGLARNFGQQLAATAGMDASRGDAVVLMDADLQDPPELIGSMVELWRQGFDVVYGTRLTREGESFVKRFTASCFYRVMNRLSEVSIPGQTGDFRLMGRPVVEVLRQMPERHRFIRGMVAWAGFRQTAIAYDRPKRHVGVTKYPLRKMIRFAADGIFSFSVRPLQLSITLGLMAATLALVGIAYALFMRIFTSTWVEGWTALMIAVLFMGGVQLVSLGILGEYVGRVYSEVKRRPLYVVRERIGFSEEEGKT